jgi:hypothetical protein
MMQGMYQRLRQRLIDQSVRLASNLPSFSRVTNDTAEFLAPPSAFNWQSSLDPAKLLSISGAHKFL